MKNIFIPASIILNVFTPQMPQGQSFEVFIPEWAKSVAIDADGKIHAFDCNAHNLEESPRAPGTWSSFFADTAKVADLEFSCDNWRILKFDLSEIDRDNRSGGVFEVKQGV